MLSELLPQPLSPWRKYAVGIDGGESVVSATFLRAILEISEPAGDVKPTRAPTLTTRDLRTACDSSCARVAFATRTAGVATRPTEASCNHEGTSAWATLRPSAAMLMSC
jgi:hypothetical protein